MNSEAVFKIGNLKDQAKKLIEKKEIIAKFTFNKDANATIPSCITAKTKLDAESLCELDIVTDTCKLIRASVKKDANGKFVCKGMTKIDLMLAKTAQELFDA